jgi:hypothetical protein
VSATCAVRTLQLSNTYEIAIEYAKQQGFRHEGKERDGDLDECAANQAGSDHGQSH